jgi:gliding motility-associated-like protein
VYKCNTYKISLFNIALILFGNFSYGQLGFCSGNSGDPIFSETFGTGITNGPALPAGTTTYNYINGAPQDGQYTVANNTGYFDWFSVPDHTPGDTNGKCLIVNASFTPGEFYRRTVTGLCGSTSYEFSAWLINLLPQTGCGNAGNPVNVSFEIWDSSDTNILASGDTGNIFGTVTPDWNQYALVFQTLNNQTAVILKMINNGIGGCGNDLAIDDIVFKTCGDFIFVEDNSSNTSVSLCLSETPYSSLLEAIPDNSVFDSYAYQWQQSTDGIIWTDIPGETNQTYQASGITTTTYFRVKVAESSINLANDSCNTISEEYAIIVFPDFSPPTSDGDVLFNCSINQAVLTVSVPDGFTVNWYNAPINGTLLESNNPTFFTSSETGTFYAEAVNIATGCKSQFRTPVNVIRVDPDPPISDGDVLFNCTNGEAVLSVSVPSGVSVDWFDAPSGGTLLQLDSETHNTTSQTGTFYAQAEDETTGCISLTRTPISVTIELPAAPTSNGDVQFDCTLDEAILSVAVPSGVSANWYDSNGNLLLSGSTSYTATVLGLYYAESVLLSNGCTSLDLVQIDVFSINPDPPISNGDVEVSCNTATGVLTVTVPAGILVDWYDSPAGGALLETNSTTYTTNIPGTYYAEAIDGTTNCKSITRTAVSLFAGNEFPNVEDEFLTFCEDDTIVLDAGISDVTYLWSTGETTREIVVNQPGTYTVIVTNSSNCSSTKTIELIQIDKPLIESINSDGYELEILTTEQGDFQYSLDDVFYQTSNVFNVEGGLYNVYVQGRDGCGKVSMEYIHFVIPKFFTPNNDGTNDTFDLKGIEYYSSSSVYIFDRYGKLLKSAKNQPFSWNGTYNSENLPSEDYWYNITIENQIFRGHFTLKR